MMRSIIAILRLYFIHIFAFFAVGLSMYYPPWDIVLAILYLTIIGREACSLRNLTTKTKVSIILTWQGPAVLLLILILSGITFLDIKNYSFFIMLFWYTPLLPFLSVLPRLVINGLPLYYYILLSLPFFMSIFHFLLSRKKKVYKYFR